MGIKKINFSRFPKNITRQIAKNVETGQEQLFHKLRRGSPVDTGEYQKSHIKKAIRITDNKVIAEIVNVDDKALNVENGWRTTPVNWHIASGRILKARGAEVYKRAVAQMGPGVVRNIETTVGR